MLRLQKVLSLTLNQEATEAERLIDEADTLLNEWEGSHDRAVLDKALEISAKALTLVPPSHPDRCIALDEHARALIDQFEGADDKSAIIPLISDLEETISLLPLDHEERGTRLGLLGIYLVIRYGRVDRRAEDIERGIQCLFEALDLLPDSSTSDELPINRETCMSILLLAFFSRYKGGVGHPDLQRAVNYSLKLLELRPEGHPLRDESLGWCGTALSERYSDLGILADLDASIAYQRQALQLRPPGDKVRANNP